MPSHNDFLHKRKRAFSLVELSIVLVILGLLVGGILSGKALIHASELRAQMTQIDKFRVSVNTFRIKYNAIPGDMLYSDAQAFGFFYKTTGVAGYSFRGDGNGLIEGGGLGNGWVYLNGEPLMFFRHLTDSKLIEGSYAATTGVSLGNITTDGFVAVAATTAGEANLYIPPAKLGRGMSLTVGSPDASANYYVLSAISAIDTGGIYTATNPVYAEDAYNMDTKLDDGKPGTGGVFAINALSGLATPSTWTTVSAVPSCVSGGVYVLSAGETAACSLRFKF